MSEYLLGKVYVKVFFVESNEKSQNTEDWTDKEKEYCRKSLEKALHELRNRFVREFETEPGSGKLLAGVNLEFVVDYETVDVSYEPIKLGEQEKGVAFSTAVAFLTGNSKLWINEIMSEKGFSNKTPPAGPQPVLPYPPFQYNVAEYADHLRNTNGTDWATVIFFIDNSNGQDSKSSKKNYAWHPIGLGGPGLILSNNLPNNSGKPYPDNVYIGMIHEFLHVWYALDEHSGNKHFREDAVLGYLGGQNLNYKEAKGFKCIMNGANWPHICPYTRKQIGWTDSDGDHIPDILDVAPGITVFPDTEKGSAIYKGRAFSPPLPNRNPYSEGGTIKPPHDLSVVMHLVPVPERRLGIRNLFTKVPAFNPSFPWTRNDITINKIISVEYRVLKDDKLIRSWIRAKSSDGAFDYASEDFEFAVVPLKPGIYTLEVRSENSVHLCSDIARINLEL